MKKIHLWMLTLAFLWLFAAPQQAQAQEYCSYGLAYGVSWTWQDNNAVYGYSATALDYCAGLYYDPAVYGRFSEGNFATENVRLLADAYTEGYADWIPAEIGFAYGAPRSFEYYNTDSIHYVLEYYQYYACFSNCGYFWYDPWGYGFAEGGYPGPNYYGYGGTGYWSVRRRRLGNTYHTIIFQPPNQCQPGQSFAPNGDSCPNPTPTPTPTPTPSETVSVHYDTEDEQNGIPMAGSAVGALPNRNSTPITATGSPSGGTFKWSTSSDKVSLSSTSGPSITVTARKPSDAVGDVVITLIYELPDGRRAPVQDIHMTVQKPAGMKYLSTTSDAATAPHRRTRRGRLVSGWKKVIVWQIVDQLGHAIDYRLPVADTINNNANDCLVPRQGEGTPLSKGFGSDGAGKWPHTYELFSPVCLNGGSCSGVTGFQRYTVNGVVLSNDDKDFKYQCNGIQLEGDGSTIPPPGPAPRKTTAAFTDQFYTTAFSDWASDDELQSWTSRLNTAAGQSQAQLLNEARALARAVFDSPEYRNVTSRSDEDFITDLYNGYLGRAPDQGGFDNWLSVYRNDMAQGLNGFEHMLQAFEYSTEFANLVYSLEAAPPPSSCDAFEEQNCNNNGGFWDSSNCFCDYPPPPDPCYSGYGYYCY
jgi:hypothetical protein